VLSPLSELTVVLLASPMVGGALAESSTRPLPVLATATLFGVEFFVEGVVMLILSVLFEILRGSTLMHLS
jgi:hypothetical protein